jgi:hypothetical protein
VLKIITLAYNGTFYHAVWDERVPGTVTDNLTVNLGKPHASVKIYDPTIGTAAVQTLTNVSSKLVPSEQLWSRMSS